MSTKPVAIIYRKPITGEMQGDADVVWKRLKGQFLRRLRVQIQQTAFSQRAKVALSKAMKAEVKQSSLVLTVNHPAWRPLVSGQKAQQMVWLRRSPTPIPIITESGQLIFRTATAKSMQDGRWVHPGRRPDTFVETARKEARAWAKKKIPGLIAQDMAKKLRGK